MASDIGTKRKVIMLEHVGNGKGRMFTSEVAVLTK
jgi:hypothetical protein